MGLAKDWVQFVMIFKNSIVSQRRLKVSKSKKYRFGNELVTLNNQFYRSFHLNYILNLSLFGNPQYSSLFPHEIIHRSNKVVVIHLLSHKRCDELLCLGGLKVCTFYKTDRKYFCCGKVNLVKNGRSIIGYIMDEDQNYLCIKVPGIAGNMIKCNRPKYNANDGQYIYNTEALSNNHFCISEMWPLKLKISDNGKAAIIMSTTSHDIDSSEYKL